MTQSKMSSLLEKFKSIKEKKLGFSCHHTFHDETIDIFTSGYLNINGSVFYKNRYSIKSDNLYMLSLIELINQTDVVYEDLINKIKLSLPPNVTESLIPFIDFYFILFDCLIPQNMYTKARENYERIKNDILSYAFDKISDLLNEVNEKDDQINSLLDENDDLKMSISDLLNEKSQLENDIYYINNS